MSPERIDEPLLLTAAEVADLLRCSPDHVLNLWRKGHLEAVDLSLDVRPAAQAGRRLLRFTRASVDRFLAERTRAVAPAPVAAPRGAPGRAGRAGFRAYLTGG